MILDYRFPAAFHASCLFHRDRPKEKALPLFGSISERAIIFALQALEGGIAFA